MELWLILTLVAAVAASVSKFLDNYITDEFFKGKTAQAVRCIYGPIYLVTAPLLICGCLISLKSFPIPATSMILIALSAFLEFVAGIPYYKALKTENTTSAVIFSQLSPIFYLILSFLVFGEQITIVQLVAFFIILSAPALIIFLSKKRNKNMELRTAFLFVSYVFLNTVSGILYVLATKGAKAEGDSLGAVGLLVYALHMLVWGILGTSSYFFVKKWRKRCRQVLKESKRKIFLPILVNEGVWFVANFSFKYAQSSGQVALVSVINITTELVATFVLGILLTIIWPKFGREKLDRRTIVSHLIAVVLATIGIILLEKPDIFLINL